MKIRNGFVSNSSSSSFIIRGISVKTEDLLTVCNIVLNKDYNIKQQIEDALEDKNIKDLVICCEGGWESARYAKEIVIGDSLGDFDCGELKEIPEYSATDNVVLYNKLIDAGFDMSEQNLHTYIQFCDE